MTANSRITLFNELCINLEQETNPMLFGKNLLHNRHTIIKLNREGISVIENISNLGILLDSKLNFLDHPKSERSKIMNFAMGFRKFRFFNGGIIPTIIKMWYKRVIAKQITYAFEIGSPI